MCVYKHFENHKNYTNVRILNNINEYLFGEKNVYIFIKTHIYGKSGFFFAPGLCSVHIRL